MNGGATIHFCCTRHSQSLACARRGTPGLESGTEWGALSTFAAGGARAPVLRETFTVSNCYSAVQTGVMHHVISRRIKSGLFTYQNFCSTLQ
jgi:hypothetical protein